MEALVLVVEAAAASPVLGMGRERVVHVAMIDEGGHRAPAWSDHDTASFAAPVAGFVGEEVVVDPVQDR